MRGPLHRWGALLALLPLAACGERTLFAPEGIGTLVIDGVLIVGEPMPTVYVSRTLEPDAGYSSAAAAVEGATVTITVEDRRIRLVETVGRGAYVPLESVTVEPETRYRLDVVAPDGREASAETLTPPAFAVDEWVLLDDRTLAVVDTLRTFAEAGAAVYDSTGENVLTYSVGLLEARFDRVDVPAFQVALSSLDLESDFVIDPDFFEDEDFEELERESSSPLLVAPDGTVRLPWLAIYFEGRYRTRLYALDRNWYDLVRTSPELGAGGPGFGGNLGDGIDSPIFHVEGGIGLFGSASVDSLGFYVRPAPGGRPISPRTP
jgi:hypothetical protein